MKIGYLGPEGTFSQMAALKYASHQEEECQLEPFSTIPLVLKAVEEGKIDECVVPFENSIEGTVNFTIDSLVFDVDLEMKSEIVIPISHNIATRKGCENIKPVKIISHPQSLAQCRKYLENNYSYADTVQVSSNSEAARIVSSSQEPWFCVTTEAAAKIYDLSILDSGIQDEKHNETRFVAVGKKECKIDVFKGKTSIVFSTENKPGELYKVLDIMSIWDLNMTKIESRPMKNQLGTYVFFVDIECHNPDDVRDALKMIKRKTTFFKHLGTYDTIE